MELQNSLLNSPLESAQKVTRNAQKVVEQSMKNFEADLKRIAQTKSVDEASQCADATIRRLRTFKRKLDDYERGADKHLQRTRTRLKHLIKHSNSDQDESAACDDDDGDSRLSLSQRYHLATILTNHCFHEGHHDAGMAFVGAFSRCLPGFGHLINTDLFNQMHQVRTSLGNHDTSLALKFCAQNRSRLNRLGSPFEFHVRLQEFIGLVTAQPQDLHKALAHARQHLQGQLCCQGDRQTRLQEVVASIAFWDPVTRQNQIVQYQKYYSASAWGDLSSEFDRTVLSLSSMQTQSPLEAVLRGGLYALKTPSCSLGAGTRPPPPPPPRRQRHSLARCFNTPALLANIANTTQAWAPHDDDDESKSEADVEMRSHSRVAESACPCCVGASCEVARMVPVSYRFHSALICRLTGRRMDEHQRRPLVLPNGHVYSQDALTQMAHDNQGIVTCVVTGEKFTLEQCNSVFIM